MGTVWQCTVTTKAITSCDPEILRKPILTLWHTLLIGQTYIKTVTHFLLLIPTYFDTVAHFIVKSYLYWHSGTLYWYVKPVYCPSGTLYCKVKPTDILTWKHTLLLRQTYFGTVAHFLLLCQTYFWWEYDIASLIWGGVSARQPTNFRTLITYWVPNVLILWQPGNIQSYIKLFFTKFCRSEMKIVGKCNK